MFIKIEKCMENDKQTKRMKKSVSKAVSRVHCVSLIQTHK